MYLIGKKNWYVKEYELITNDYKILAKEQGNIC